MRFIKLFEEFKEYVHEVGDIFVQKPGVSLAFNRKDKMKDLFIFEKPDKDIEKLQGSFKITRDLEKYWKINDAYRIEKELLGRFKSLNQLDASDNEKRLSKQEKNKQVASNFSHKIGDLLKAKKDAYLKTRKGIAYKKPELTFFATADSKPIFTTGSTHAIKDITMNGIKVTGFDYEIPYTDAEKYFEL